METILIIALALSVLLNIVLIIRSSILHSNLDMFAVKLQQIETILSKKPTPSVGTKHDN